MKTSNFILLAIVCSMLFNCTYNDLESGLPYFHFINEDRPNLLNLPELNSRLTFVNQNNEKLEFDVVKSETVTDFQGKGNWVTSSIKKFFYYDKQEIFLSSPLFENDNIYNYFRMRIKRWPKTFKDGSDGRDVIISQESQFISEIYYSPFRNKGISVILDYNNPVEMTLGNKTYIKIIKIDLSETESSNCNNCLVPGLNYIYFDINKGFIGFEDRDGNEWTLKN